MDAKGGVKIFEQAVSIVREPAFVAEFKDGDSFFGQGTQESTQAVKVFVEIRGQLIKNRAEVLLQKKSSFEEAGE